MFIVSYVGRSGDVTLGCDALFGLTSTGHVEAAQQREETPSVRGASAEELGTFLSAMSWIIKIPEGACSFRKTTKKITVCAGSPQRRRDPRIFIICLDLQGEFPSILCGCSGTSARKQAAMGGQRSVGPPHRGPRRSLRVAERRPGPARTTGTSKGHRVSPTGELHGRHLIHESLKFSNCFCCEMSTIRCPDRNSMTQTGTM